MGWREEVNFRELVKFGELPQLSSLSSLESIFQNIRQRLTSPLSRSLIDIYLLTLPFLSLFTTGSSCVLPKGLAYKEENRRERGRAYCLCNAMQCNALQIAEQCSNMLEGWSLSRERAWGGTGTLLDEPQNCTDQLLWEEAPT